MTETTKKEWTAANQQYLLASMAVISALLEAGTRDDDPAEIRIKADAAQERLEAAQACLPAPAALDILGDVFGLSYFEKALLIMCAGVELDSSFAALVAGLQGNPQSYLPTFSLALAAIPGAHWSAVSPGAPLRYWRIISLQNDQLISKAPIKIDEYILHYLAGVHYPDARLAGIAVPFQGEIQLVPSHLALAGQILQASEEKWKEGTFRAIQLSGDNKNDKDSIAACLSRKTGLRLYTIAMHALPSTPGEITELARTWNREAALKSCALLVDYTELDVSDKMRVQLVNVFIDHVQGMCIISCGEQTSVRPGRKPIIFNVNKPTAAEQIALWKTNLDEAHQLPEMELSRLVAQFNFSTKTIHAASRDLAGHSGMYVNGNNAEQVLSVIWKSCCVQARPDIGELAQRIEQSATMNDLVLPAAQKEILKELVVHVKHRSKVYTEWGFAQRNNRGLGITALFAGESGTGKTMASEVLAKELNLDLYRIDLSQVVNKYIGETEKNLKRIFDAAEDGGAILLFDEADALFGKRSEIKDSHDRYANVEISYLLQRMEAYRGLAILTTNMKNVMDKAWMRRIRFMVQFPFPDAEQRAEIWKHIFPPETPTDKLDTGKLSRLNIAGGNIKNIAMNAAFIAAGEGTAVGMSHVQRALRSEYEKMEKPLTNIEMAFLK